MARTIFAIMIVLVATFACTPRASERGDDVALASSRFERAASVLKQRGLPARINGDVVDVGGRETRTVDVTVFRIDRRPNRPRVVEERDVPAQGGLRVRVQHVEMLPQIMTQYMSPPGGAMATFALQSPEGAVVVVERWYGPRDMRGPAWIVETEAAPDVPAELVDAVARAALY